MRFRIMRNLIKQMFNLKKSAIITGWINIVAGIIGILLTVCCLICIAYFNSIESEKIPKFFQTREF